MFHFSQNKLVMNRNLRFTGFILVILYLSGCSLKEGRVIPFETGNYLQEIKIDVKLPGVNAPSIARLFRLNDKIVALASDTIFEFQQGKWRAFPLKNQWQAATTDIRGSLWLGSSSGFVNFGTNPEMSLPPIPESDTLNCLLWEDDKILHSGTNHGLWTWNGLWSRLTGTEAKKVRQILKATGNELWLATSDGLFRRNDDKWLNLDDYVMAPGLMHNYYSLSTGITPGSVVFGSELALSQISPEGNHWNFTGEDGLPFGPVTTICPSGRELWLGTPDGAIRKDESWHYYHGKRWLPDDKVNDILVIDPHTVWIATPKGISEIRQRR